MELKILYEDNHLIAVSKPAGVPTQGDQTKILSLLDATKTWLKEKYQKKGNVFLGLVHRLDKPVAGIVLFAKTSKAASRLGESFRSRQVRKVYLAVVEGKPKISIAELESFLVPGNDGIVRIAPEGKKACLRYQALESKEGRTLLSVELGTGRKHQIRVQLSHAGFPICGDRKYGSEVVPREDGGIALYAFQLELPHPTRREERVSIEDSLAKTYLSEWW